MGKRKTYSLKNVVEVYRKKGCNITATCVALKNISRTTFYKWREEDEKLDEALTNVEEELIDFSESKLMEQVSEGNLTAIIFHLKTKGKKRGYIEGLEVEDKKTSDLDLSGLSDEEIATVMALLRKAKKK